LICEAGLQKKGRLSVKDEVDVEVETAGGVAAGLITIPFVQYSKVDA